MSNLNAITKVAKGYAAAMPDIEQVTVAALDESISGTGQPFKNLYMVIVCSPPGTKGREKLPGLVQDLETLGDYGLLIWRNTSDLSRGEASGLSRGEALAKAWIRGLTDLVKQAQNELMVMRYPPIGLLYVDGPMRPELYPLMGMGLTRKLVSVTRTR
ncbi:hypothetical protein HYU20_00345 [Candidatus Woesearchaeota archaeon]|nr:hypothetical protein [Candidatus Woesearchaeota archaeon]